MKELEFVEGDMLEKKVKCNFRVMGKKFGKLMKAVAAAVGALSQDAINELSVNGSVQVDVDGQTVEIVREDVEIVSEDIPGWTVANDGALTVALDLEITEELKNEGMAREIVKRIQAYRKSSGLKSQTTSMLSFHTTTICRRPSKPITIISVLRFWPTNWNLAHQNLGKNLILRTSR